MIPVYTDLFYCDFGPSPSYARQGKERYRLTDPHINDHRRLQTDRQPIQHLWCFAHLAHASAGCVVRQRWWVALMVAFDILAISFQWVLHVVSVSKKDDGTPMTKTFSEFKYELRGLCYVKWGILNSYGHSLNKQCMFDSLLIVPVKSPFQAVWRGPLYKPVEDANIVFYFQSKHLDRCWYVDAWSFVCIYTCKLSSFWLILPHFPSCGHRPLTGISIIGPLAIREMKSEQSYPIWAVIPLSFCLCVVPPYALAGMALSGLVSSATIVTTFTVLTIVAIVMMIASSLFIVLFIMKKQTDQHPSYAIDVVVELKVSSDVRIVRISVVPLPSPLPTRTYAYTWKTHMKIKHQKH